jgi:stringent starvation protein B
MKNAVQTVSTRPYLIRALFEWCNDNALTPYIAVKVDSNVQVPKEYVQNNEIVLNISMDATSGLQIGNDYIEFKARFGGVPRQIIVPVGQVLAIYAKENGQGMAFPAPVPVHEGDIRTQEQNLNPVTNHDLSSESTAPSVHGGLTLMQKNASSQQSSTADSLNKTKLSQDHDQSHTSDMDEDPTPPSPLTPRPKLTRIK